MALPDAVKAAQRTLMLLGTISGRLDYSAAGERFEDVTMLLFGPVKSEGDSPWVKLYSATPRPELKEFSEQECFIRLRDIYNLRNPHAQVGVEELKVEGE